MGVKLDALEIDKYILEMHMGECGIHDHMGWKNAARPNPVYSLIKIISAVTHVVTCLKYALGWQFSGIHEHDEYISLFI